MSSAHNITRVTRGLYMLNFISGGGGWFDQKLHSEVEASVAIRQ